MQLEMISPLITEFNNVINSLIDDFKEFNLDENALAFLAVRCRNFINFADLTLSNVFFSIFDGVDYSFGDEITTSKNISTNLFDEINSSLDHVLEHEHEGEHIHDHSHEHHIHVDVVDVQSDVEAITNNLIILSKLFTLISSIAVAVVKYQNDDMDDNAFMLECNNFKNAIGEFSNS